MLLSHEVDIETGRIVNVDYCHINTVEFCSTWCVRECLPLPINQSFYRLIAGYWMGDVKSVNIGIPRPENHTEFKLTTFSIIGVNTTFKFDRLIQEYVDTGQEKDAKSYRIY